MEFYVYVYYDPSRNHTPFYVGKGKGNRAWRHLNKDRRKRELEAGSNKPFYRRLDKMQQEGIQPIIGLYGGLDEELAFLVECEAIAKFGRRDNGTGILWNMTDGGEGFSGYKHTDEAKAKIAASKKDKPLSESHRESLRRGHAASQRVGHWKDKEFTPEHRAAIAASRQGKVTPPETRAKQSASGMGRIVSAETRAKQSIAARNRKRKDT